MKNCNKNKFFILIALIFLFTNISANCKEGQINLNSASKSELDKLIGIGPAKATEIINSRPFDEFSDLLKVNGIGEATLQGIKDQGLACIEEKNENIGEKDDEENEIVSVEKEIKYIEEGKTVEENSKSQEINSEELTGEIIKLDSKSIKSQTNSKNSSNRYAIYGLIFFCVLLFGLFIARRKEIFSKNEFK